MSFLDDLDKIGLPGYKKPKFFPGNSFSSGKSNRKQPYIVARKWFGVYLIQSERFEGRSTVKVTDESKGYSKILARSTGLGIEEAERIYNSACEVMRRVK